MDDDAADVSIDTLFEREFRGYHKQQVQDYVAWLQEQTRSAQHQVKVLEARLAEAEGEIARLRASSAG